MIQEWINKLEVVRDSVWSYRMDSKGVAATAYNQHLRHVVDDLNNSITELQWIHRQADCPVELKGGD